MSFLFTCHYAYEFIYYNKNIINSEIKFKRNNKATLKTHKLAKRTVVLLF